jgi:phosphatidylcholine synthase
MRAFAYGVHALTASGIFLALLAVSEATSDAPDPRWVFLWLGLAILLDAADGPLARAAHVKRNAPSIDGRTIDDLVDYLTYTFIPLLLVLRMGWLAGPDWLSFAAVGLAMFTSLLGFAHRLAKDEQAGFFRGFPSYWNLMAYYFGLWATYYGTPGSIAVTASLVLLSVLTLLPVRFMYLNLAPRPWKAPMMAGALVWGLLLVAALPWYPHPEDPDGAIPEALMWASLAYPVVYAIASLRVDARLRGLGR